MHEDYFKSDLADAILSAINTTIGSFSNQDLAIHLNTTEDVVNEYIKDIFKKQPELLSIYTYEDGSAEVLSHKEDLIKDFLFAGGFMLIQEKRKQFLELERQERLLSVQQLQYQINELRDTVGIAKSMRMQGWISITVSVAALLCALAALYFSRNPS